MKRIFFQFVFMATMFAGLMVIFSACQQEQIIDDLSTTITDNSEETDFRLPPLILADAVEVDLNDCCNGNGESRTIKITLNNLTCNFYGNNLYYYFYDYNAFGSPNVIMEQASSLCEPEFCLPISNYAILISSSPNCELSYDGNTVSYSCKNGSPIYEAFLPTCPLEGCHIPDVSDITWTYNGTFNFFTVCADAFNGDLHQFRYRYGAIDEVPANWITLNPTTQSCSIIPHSFIECLYDVQLRVMCPWGWTEWTEIESVYCKKK